MLMMISMIQARGNNQQPKIKKNTAIVITLDEKTNKIKWWENNKKWRTISSFELIGSKIYLTRKKQQWFVYSMYSWL